MADPSAAGKTAAGILAGAVNGAGYFCAFVAFFGFIALLFFGGLAVAAYLLTRFFGGDGQMAALVWILGCSLALALPLAGHWSLHAGFPPLRYPFSQRDGSGRCRG